MPSSSSADFFSKYDPFNRLTEAELQALIRAASFHTFARHSTILTEDGEPSEYLYVVAKGSVRMSVHASNGDEVLLDLRTVGEHYGLSSMLRGVTLINVVAAEDTACYLIPQGAVMDAMKRNPAFGEAMVQASMQRYLEHSLRQIRNAEAGSAETALFSLSARALIKRPLVACGPDITIQSAAQTMKAESVSSLLISGDDSQIAGIVTDRDLRNRVVAPAVDLARPVRDIMTTPVITIQAGAPAVDALLLMLNSGVQHLPVLDGGRPEGVITAGDLALLQGSSPILFVNEVSRAEDVDALDTALQRANASVTSLFRQGAHPWHVARVLAEIHDRIAAKLLDLGQAGLGPAPCVFCWAVAGGEGRLEQTFQSDKRSLVIYADPPDAAAAEYFSALGEFMTSAQSRLGLTQPNETVPAANTLSEWQAALLSESGVQGHTIAEWPEEVLDLRAVGGSVALAGALQVFLLRQVREQPVYRRQAARRALASKPALDRDGELLVESSGQGTGRFDLQLRGSWPLAALVRLWALEHAVRETTTLDRLQALMAAGVLTASAGDDLRHAFEYFLLLRLRHQQEQIRRARLPDNYLDRSELDPIDRASLKEAFQILAWHQAAAARQYGLSGGG